MHKAINAQALLLWSDRKGVVHSVTSLNDLMVIRETEIKSKWHSSWIMIIMVQ